MLREALKVPTDEGLLRHDLRRGCFVNEVSEQDPDELFPVIAMLQGRCAFEAARKASDADLAALDSRRERFRVQAQAGRIDDDNATKLTRHEAIITRANKRWLAQAMADLRNILKLARLQQLNAPGRLTQSLREHLVIHAALRARDSAGAEEALRELTRTQKSRLLA